MPFLPDVISLGQFPLAVGALTGLLGALAAYWLSGPTAGRAGLEVETARDLVLNLLIGGIAGAKLLYVALDPISHLRNPITLILFPYGPWALPAGLLGGAALAAWSLRRQPDALRYLDAAALPLMLGLAVALTGWRGPGTWSFTPALSFAALVLAAGVWRRPLPRPGLQAAYAAMLTCAALAVADLTRLAPGASYGVTGLQWSTALAATALWLWTRRRSEVQK